MGVMSIVILIGNGFENSLFIEYSNCIKKKMCLKFETKK